MHGLHLGGRGVLEGGEDPLAGRPHGSTRGVLDGEEVLQRVERGALQFG